MTFIFLPERHQTTLDKLDVLMEKFPRVINDMNSLESEFIEYQATADDEFLPYFDKNDNPMCTDHI